MKTEKEAAVSRKTDETKTHVVASIEFAVRASLREEYVDTDFVHSILGRVFVKTEDLQDEEDAGSGSSHHPQRDSSRSPLSE